MENERDEDPTDQRRRFPAEIFEELARPALSHMLAIVSSEIQEGRVRVVRERLRQLLRSKMPPFVFSQMGRTQRGMAARVASLSLGLEGVARMQYDAHLKIIGHLATAAALAVPAPAKGAVLVFGTAAGMWAAALLFVKVARVGLALHASSTAFFCRHERAVADAARWVRSLGDLPGELSRELEALRGASACTILSRVGFSLRPGAHQ